ncbi:unnamed protein product [Symbiodinium necroappetens]|uniref:EF-hand domain-containing protein n=1 Tax=Symbiodinium necroappetens TaxID=1628268 RepID=A0A812RAS6_9DINO|nr:unnamed protein product [Symbiodinium necroappetens]
MPAMPAMPAMWRLLGACLAVQQAWQAAATEATEAAETCATGHCEPKEGASSSSGSGRQHWWPYQKGTPGRTGYSPYAMPDITKGPAWTQEAPHGDVVRSTPLIDDQKNIYVTTVAGRTYKLSGMDGKPLWSHYTGSRGSVPGVPSLWDSVMLMLTKNGFLIALDLDTGVERWEKQIVTQVAASCDCGLLTQGILVVAVMDPEPLKLWTDPNTFRWNNRILGLSLDDGSFRWSFAPKQPTYNFQGSTIHDGTFVFQDVTGGVYRMSTEGRLIWHAATPDRVSGTTAAAVIHDGRVFAVSNLGGGPQLYGTEGKGLLHVYGYEDGTFLWSQDLPYEGNQAVAVGDLVGSKSRASLVLGMGKNPWLPVYANWGMVLIPIIGFKAAKMFLLPFHWLSLSYPSLFAKKQGRSIVALDAATGNVLWYHEMEPYQRPAAMGDSELLIERYDSIAHGTNPNNDPWCLPDANAQPVIDGAGTALVPFQDGKIYAIRDENGDGKISPEEVKEHLVGAAFQASPALAPGLLAVVDCSGRLEVFRD